MRFSGVILTMGVLLCTAGCATTAGDWRNASSVNTIEAYQEFISQHPNTQQANDAKERIRNIEAGRAFEQVKNMNTMEAYETFLSTNPPKKYETEAKKLLKIAKAAKDEDALDDNDWTQAEKKNSVSSFFLYFQRHPKGKHVVEAKQRGIKQLSNIKPMINGDIEKLKSDLNQLANPYSLKEIKKTTLSVNSGGYSQESKPRPTTSKFTFLFVIGGYKSEVLTIDRSLGFAGFMNTGVDASGNVHLPDSVNPVRLFALRSPLADDSDGIGYEEVILYAQKGAIKDHFIKYNGSWFRITE